MAVQALLSTLRCLRSTNVAKSLSEWHHDAMGYRQKGLLYDDLIPEENELVQAAPSRLTPKQHHDRVFRHRRAINLGGQQITLDKADWIKPHEDIRYLTPLINQVENEIATKQNFDNMTTIPAALLKRNNSTSA
ncbi:Cytochrome b-c1 complex subunit 7 [Geranomyces variabilis]|uniref:Complex III subunit 7 n=1 Tax=Geranomyces variabilis TaxID=109894 RepID=A0AAD5TNB4_9FUNG|nr:Cytochrome b-c1 complex subunit 7 [Geranomyces variabilis]